MWLILRFEIFACSLSYPPAKLRGGHNPSAVERAYLSEQAACDG